MGFTVIFLVGLTLLVLMSDYWRTSSRSILFKVFSCIVCLVSWITLATMILP